MASASLSLLVLIAIFLPLFPFIKCCPPAPCGILGTIEYPFTKNKFDEFCGPFVVDDCNKEMPKIQFERRYGKWYQVENFSPVNSSSRNVSVFDKELQTQLNSKKCESFDDITFLNHQNITLPYHPNISIEMNSGLKTIYKCNKSIDLPYPNSNYANYTKCSDFNIFYSTKHNPNISSPLLHCQIVELPLNTNYDHVDIFQMLTANFSLIVTIWPETKPPLPPKNKQETKLPPPPKNYEESRWKLVGIGCAILAAIILMVIIAFFWRRYNKRKEGSSNLLSTTFSKSDREVSNIFFGVSIFSYTELEEATNNFASENVLGDGGFGIVHYGKLQDGREVAVKRLYERNYHKVQQFLNEIEILTCLRHKNLVSLYGCTSRRSRELLLVYEYIPNGTVADHLHGDRASSSPLTWPIRMRIAIETASALVYLHASDIIHRDVKTNNILLDNYFSVKVADFGISRLFPNDVTHISTAPQGTPGYMDPEYHQCYQLTDRSDVYSFGVVLAELLSSMPAVDITRQRHEINLARLAVNKIQKSAFDELIDPGLGYHSDEEVKRMTTSVAELAFLCLQQNRELRPTMDEVLEKLLIIENPQYDPQDVVENHDNA